MGELSPGSSFAGHRIEAVAGRGGMGIVYRASQLSLDRQVALKVIAPSLMQDEAIRRRFLRESKVAASIDHPNVIPIYYTGEERGVAFIAMRYVPGDDLRTLVRREGPLAPRRAAAIVSQVAAALDAAHAAGLVHRDVKPANVLLGPDEHVYLTDFGLTKGEVSEGATQPGHWVGTLDFVAPEQIRGERIDARADVYSLGCLLFYALTGRPPYSYDNDEAKLWAHLSEDPPVPSKAAPGVPTELDAVIARALAKNPDERYPSAGDLGRAALAAAAGEQATVADRERMVAVGAAAPIEVETRTAHYATTPLTASRRPQKRRRRPLVIAAALAALVATGAAVGYALQSGDDGRPDGAAATPTPTAAGEADRVESVRVGGRINTIAHGGGRVWAGDSQRRRLHAVDPDGLRRLQRISPRIGAGIDAMTVSGRTIWAVSTAEHRLFRIDARSGRPRGEPIALPLTANANSVVANRDGVWVAVTTPELDPGDQILEFDSDTGELRRTLTATDRVRRLALLDGGLWFLASRPARVVRIDLETRKRRRVRLDGETAGDLSVGHGYVWASLRDTNQLARIDPRTEARATVAVGSSPVGVAVQGDSVWVANVASSTLTRVDAESMRAREEVEVPLNPYELASGGDAVWSGSLADGAVTRVAATAD
jgi:streptogramin lyase/predicted Ser/Thr protein kinase